MPPRRDWRRMLRPGLAAGLLSVCPAVAKEPSSCPPAADLAVVGVRAVDGDTFETESGSVVRLAGVEAPKGFGFGDADRAEMVRQALERRIAGVPIGLATVGDGPDRYDRIVADAVLPDGRWLQAELAAAGQVRVRPTSSRNDCIAELLAIEDGARRTRRGLWARAGHLGVRNADDPSLSERNGLYEIVEGRVRSVGYGSYMVFLDFGSTRRDFTVMVPPTVVEELAEAGRPVDGLRGRRVRVRGVIEEGGGGPAIRLESTVALELAEGE